MRCSLLLLPVLLFTIVACTDEDGGHDAVTRLEDGVMVTPREAGASWVRVRALNSGLFHVTASPGEDFERPVSLMRSGSLVTPEFDVVTNDRSVNVVTAGATAAISLDTGAVRFLDAGGKQILAERESRRFTPFDEHGRTRYAIRQRFEPGPDDAFYGLGQHQNGQFNYRGQNVELAQHNISIAVPFVVSTGGYGILWDNASITRFGDPRPFAGLDEQLMVRGPDGSQGGLEGVYFKGHEEAARVREADPDYEFLDPDQFVDHDGRRNVWPEPFVDKSPDRIAWRGSIEAKTPGLHKFRVYASSYIKVRIDGEVVVDRWRQNWNPYYFLFELEMQPGVTRNIEIDWLPNDGYFRIGHLGPQPADEASDLSLYSEVADVIDYYFVSGDSLQDVIAGYRKLTGKAVLLPRWSYGFWQSRQRYTTQQELLDVLSEYRRRKIPIDNMVLDWFYWPEDAWGSHSFDSERFPDPQGMVDAVHEMDANIMISVWPKFYPSTENFKELEALDAVYPRNLEKETLDWVGPGYASTFYDPYLEDARETYWRQMQENLGVLGFDAWWMDATEPDLHSNLSHEERKLRMGPTALGSGAEYFNSYALMNAMSVYEGERNSPDADERVFILTRSGFPGIQRYAAASWSGDIVARWDDLKEQISAGLNISMSGLPNWTFDIGGFAVEQRYTNEDPEHLAEWQELNLRWFQFGAFAPLFRSHGEYPYREIFNLAEEGTEVYESLVHYDRLRYRLMPYIYSTALGTYHDDGSIMRPLVMDFSDDQATHDIGDEYLFGPSILVAPVYEYKARERRVYLPAGSDWYEFESNRRHTGGRWIDTPAPLARMPLFVRAGAIIPTGPDSQTTAGALNSDLTLLVYPGDDGSFRLLEDDGVSYAYERGGFSSIPTTWDDARGILTIARREGAFDGMAGERDITLRLMGGEPLEKTVRYSGEAVSLSLME